MTNRRMNILNMTHRAPLMRALKITGITIVACGIILYIASYFIGIAVILVGVLCAVASLNEGNMRLTLSRQVVPALKSCIPPTIGILLAFIVGALFMLVARYNPLVGYGALLYGGFIKNWPITILNAVPLIFTGLAVAVAFQAGLFNIGAEGQYYIGAMAAAALGIYLDIPGALAIPFIFIIGGLLASSYVLIPAILKTRTGAHEVITTMMFAHIARLLSPLMVRNFGGHITSPHPLVTYEILPQLFLPLFADFLPDAYSRLHIGILIAIICAIGIHYILWRTPIGFEIRAVGHNRHAARAQGISVARIYIITLLSSGFLAGTAGVVQVLGLDHKLFENLSAGYGWNGISVALLAGNRPIPLIFTALLWAALDSGGQYMQRTVSIPSSVVELIKGVVLFLIVARLLYVYVYKKMGTKTKQEAH